MTLCYNVLNVSTGGGTRPQTVRNSARQAGVAREVGIDVDGVEIARYSRVRLVGERRKESRGTLCGGKFVPIVGERYSETLNNSVPLKVRDNGITVRIIGLEINGSYLVQILQLISHKDCTSNRKFMEGSSILE